MTDVGGLSVSGRVHGIIAEILGRTDFDDMSSFADLGADSLDLAEILIGVEDALNLDVLTPAFDSEALTPLTVGDLVDLCETEYAKQHIDPDDLGGYVAPI